MSEGVKTFKHAHKQHSWMRLGMIYVPQERVCVCVLYLTSAIRLRFIASPTFANRTPDPSWHDLKLLLSAGTCLMRQHVLVLLHPFQQRPDTYHWTPRWINTHTHTHTPAGLTAIPILPEFCRKKKSSDLTVTRIYSETIIIKLSWEIVWLYHCSFRCSRYFTRTHSWLLRNSFSGETRQVPKQSKDM